MQWECPICGEHHKVAGGITGKGSRTEGYSLVWRRCVRCDYRYLYDDGKSPRNDGSSWPKVEVLQSSSC